MNQIILEHFSFFHNCKKNDLYCKFCLFSFLRFLQECKIGLIFKSSLGIRTTFSTWVKLSAFDNKTGTSTAVRLQKIYLHDAAIPKILPNCPSYLSSLTISRESPYSRRIRLENSALKGTLNQSIDDLANKQKKKFNDRKGKLNFLIRNYWRVVWQQETLIICSIIKSPYPKINQSLVIESDFAVHVFCSDVEMSAMGNFKISKHVTDQNTLEILLEKRKKMDTEQKQTKLRKFISLIKLIMPFQILLKEKSNKYLTSIKNFYKRQILMTQNKFDYSTEIIIFSSFCITAPLKGTGC